MAKKILIIAEAGVNHNGSIELAKKMIEVAAASGADYIKFQTFSADRIATKYAEKAEYQILATDATESQYQMLNRLELSVEMHEILLDHCAKLSIGFLSTGFDIQSVDLLVDMGIEFLKVPSGEITNLPYLRHLGQFGSKVILSTGMSTLEEIGQAISALENAGTPRTNITVLQCTTEYPAPMADVNLMAMHTIKSEFGVEVGYSDHTQGVEVAIAATALGARIIEKHFTLDRSLPGPDHKASLEPNELNEMVRAIRNIEIALGDGVKKIENSELSNKKIVRKSIVAKKIIRKGDLFTEENITVKRPGDGLSPMYWDDVLGSVSNFHFNIDDKIRL